MTASGAFTAAQDAPIGLAAPAGFPQKAPAARAKKWVQIPNSGQVTSVAQTHDGAILGVGMDKNLYVRQALRKPWVRVANSGPLASVSVLLDGAIFGVGVDGGFLTRRGLDGAWTPIPNGAPPTLLVTAVQQPNGRILAVGKDAFLYTSPSLSSPSWAVVPNSGSVLDAIRLSDGAILGVGTDHFLYRRKTTSDPWIQMPDSGLVLSVTVLKDGTLLGVGMDNKLYIRK